ncbi:MAG TPA: thioredoxin family protein [Pyrinomonadaceae bacterium]|jgi:peroxiredoxin|nr:thioredoxin family protein [Pyrinomonadaceae bacterium]
MKKLSTVALLLALSFVAAVAAVRMTKAGSARDDKPAAVALGAIVPDFTLPDPDGRQHTLASLKGKNGTVLIFMATRCPVSNGYNTRMEKLAEDYAARGVNIVGINANSTEPAGEVKQHAAEKGLTFTILKDEGSRIADRFDAQVTPETYLLDASGKLVYHGRIDNSRAGDAITSNDLRDAIEAVLAGKPVQKSEAKAFGCSIKRG